MKVQNLKSGIGSTIFILLIFAAFAVVRPVYERLRNFVRSSLENARVELEAKTGLTFSYSSLSPSILSVISVKGIVVADSDCGDKILSVRKLSLSYDLKKLFKKDFSGVLKDISISGVTVEFNSVSDCDFMEKLKLLSASSSNPDEKSSSRSSESDSEKFENKVLFAKIQELLPDVIKIRDVKLHFQDKNTEVSSRIKKIQFASLGNGKSFSADFTGLAIVKFNSGMYYSSGFNCHTVVSNNLENLSSNIFLSDLRSRDIRINSFNLLLEYSENLLHLKTLRNVFPFAMDVYSDFAEKQIKFSFSGSDFKPFQTVYIASSRPLLRRLSALETSFELSGIYELESKKLSYNSSGSVSLPEQLVAGGLNVLYSVSGNKNSVNVPHLALKGKFYDVVYSGSCNFKDIQLYGTAQVNKIQLPGGGIISSEFYFDPLSRGFMIFAPQVFLDSNALTAMQLSLIPRTDSSVDFSFEASDYSHLEAERPGVIRLDGSFLPANKYVQSSLSVEDLYLDTIVNFASFAMPSKKKSLEKFSKTASSLIFSGETYLSYDFSDSSSFSFNVPYAIVANTKADRQFFVFSLNGNSNSVQVSQLDFIYGSTSMNLTGLAELTDDKDVFFSTDMMINGIPYHIGGTASSKWIDISGDYGFRSVISFNPLPANVFEPSVSGTFHCEKIPFSFGKYIFTSTVDSNFSLNEAEGFKSEISHFDFQEVSGSMRNSPKITFAGSVNKYGFIINSFLLEDSVSLLSGDGTLLWNINDGIFDSMNMKLNAESFLSGEKWDFSADFTNPMRRPLSVECVKKDWFFSAVGSITNFPSARFMANQGKNDTVSLKFSSTGTFENPYMQLSLLPSSVSLLGSSAMFHGTAVLEAGTLSLTEADLKWILLNFSKVQASYSLENKSGRMNTELDANLMGRNIHSPLEIKIDTISSKEGDNSFMLNIASKKVEGSVFTNPFNLDLSVLHTGGRSEIYSAGDVNVNGYILSDGTVNIKTGAGCPIQSVITGYVHNDGFYFNCDEILGELSDFSPLLTFDFIAVSNGTVTGNCVISGLASDPEFNGKISIANPDFNLPIIIPEHFTGKSLDLTIENSSLVMPETILYVAGVPAYTKLELNFDRWNFDGLLIEVHTKPGEYVPADVNLGDVRITGKGRPDLRIYITTTRTDVTGSIDAKETTVSINGKVLADAAAMGAALERGETIENNLFGNYILNVDFDIMMGQGVQVLIDPMVRGVAQPGTPMHFSFDSSDNMVSIDSDITFRGGELLYLNRNFYMREGRIVFSDRQELLMDPVITVRAETRERDADGNQVTITLSAVNQLLSMFSPRFTATPAKSESEIMELLGQIVSADSSNAASLLLATGDFALQVTVIRQLETALRDLLNFDIFSIRTMVLQNAMKQGLNMNSSHERTTAGNFFDNSTVYMGKYFGRELYADALLHWSYDQDRVNDSDTVGGLVFQPEFGLEMSSPFVNIRWGIAPNIDAIKENRWIPSTSVTLSWKFAF